MESLKDRRYDDIVYYSTGAADRNELKKFISHFRESVSESDMGRFDEAVKDLYKSIEDACASKDEGSYKKAFSASEEAYKKARFLGVKNKKSDKGIRESEEGMIVSSGYDPDYITFDEASIIENYKVMRWRRNPDIAIESRVRRYSHALRAEDVYDTIPFQISGGIIPQSIIRHRVNKLKAKEGWDDPTKKNGYAQPEMMRHIKGSLPSDLSAKLARIEELRAKKDLTKEEAKEYKSLFSEFDKGFSKSAKGIYKSAVEKRKAATGK
jgi:hypothetical protein